MTTYEGKEHEPIESLSFGSIPPNNIGEQGLKLKQNHENIVLADYILGIQWLNNKQDIVKVKPKRDNIDFFTILDTCLRDPIVGQHMNQCYAINTNTPKIQVQDTELKEVLNLFLIHHFLGLVRHITRNGLKKGFTKVSENLTAKIRGKILVNPTLRHNHTKARPDKVYCQYQRFTVDCMENQILASTLEAVQKRLNLLPANGRNKNRLSNLLHQVKPYFDSVQRIPLNNQVFRQLKTHRFFRTYQQALDVAEQIHKNITQTTEISGPTFIHPFTIDMPELFERYCEALLRRSHQGLRAGYENKKAAQFNIGTPHLRPDFILQNQTESYIIDSKYKFWYSKQGHFDNYKPDLQQLALYTFHKGIMKNFERGNDGIIQPSLVFIYPNIPVDDPTEDYGGDPEKNLNIEESSVEIPGFKKIFKIPINLPTNNKGYQPS